MGNKFSKDPDAIKDYHFDWRRELREGDSIASYTVTASAGVTVDSHSQLAGVVTVWLSGGTVDTSATVTCRVVTAQGRRDDKTMLFQIRSE